MADMARKIGRGEYQIGIWNVIYDPAATMGAKWTARAIGPGTIGDGSPQTFPSLRAAHLELTGEERFYG